MQFAKFVAVMLVIGLHTAFSGGNQAPPATTIGVRNAHAMVYDSSRGYVLLFGGADASKVRGDTWSWNGIYWRQIAGDGPRPRTFPAIAFDHHRNRAILFGGNRVLFGANPDEDTFLNDTWEWDGKQWMQMKVPGPPARSEGVMVYDGKRRRAILFGGYNRTGEGVSRLGDTWTWDGIRWTQLDLAGPSGRNGAAITFDSKREKVVLFGGRSATGDTWEWDGIRWIENRLAITEKRFNSALAFDIAQGKVIRFGGYFEGRRLNDTWAYDGKTWKQLDAPGPAGRNHSAMAYDSKRRRIVLFGGHDGDNVFGDTWEWDGRRWHEMDRGQTEKRIDNDH